ncbi:hypothetical protein E2C01_073568 [Portunus trituberculatus]|uniref:Uncharacterized protein n=1 Tax=Portunus trituberculatus TaxID=210409 RepID=A0A5B7IAX3_PORTR|nr:hypothetical protein [Portunus trituberculatus]
MLLVKAFQKCSIPSVLSRPFKTYSSSHSLLLKLPLPLHSSTSPSYLPT